MVELHREKNGQLSFVPVEPERAKYTYNGPFFKFDQMVGRVQLETWASTPGKAYSNMIFQIKDKFGYQKNAKITISKNLMKKEETKYGKSV